MGAKPVLTVDVAQTLSSPLAFAIGESDRQTLAMVRDAVQSRRLRLAYQPVVMAAHTDRTGFYEGLIRVLDPTGRVIPAREFIGPVEATDLGREIDCAALAMGLDTLIRQPQIRLAINMSARSIGYPKWTQTLRAALRRHPGLGERLILEITESSAMLVPEIVITFMDDLQTEGITFALDDFGAGFTAIRLFKDFCFDILKVDGQFIRGIHRDRDNQVVTAALLAIGKQFDMLCVAEAVEHPAEAQMLQALGFDCLQGFLFGAPTVRPPWTVAPPQTATSA